MVANIGDSRTYLLREGELTQLSRDDSLVQDLIDARPPTPEQARRHPPRNVVMHGARRRPGARGTEASDPRARVGDRLLLCSDGLTDMVADEMWTRPRRPVATGRVRRAARGPRARRGRARQRLGVVADVVASPAGASFWA